HAAKRVKGGALWANLHLLFWLSLFPFTTAWVGENNFAQLPTAIYGAVLFMAAVAWWLLQRILLKQNEDSLLAAAIKQSKMKEMISPVLYLTGIFITFIQPWISGGIYTIVAIL